MAVGAVALAACAAHAESAEELVGVARRAVGVLAPDASAESAGESPGESRGAGGGAGGGGGGGEAGGAEARGVSADVWTLRRRVATRDQLVAMAVQAEQGDEACLCGKTSPTTPEVERQARLLAEAGLLYHLAGDDASAGRSLALLRNAAHKSSQRPVDNAPVDNAVVWQLHVRLAVLLGGADAGVRESAAIADRTTRLAALAGATRTAGLPTPDRRAILRFVLADVREAGVPARLREVLAGALAEAGEPREAAEIAGRDVPVAIGAPVEPAFVGKLVDELSRLSVTAAASRIDALGGDTASYFATAAGRGLARRGVAVRPIAEQVRSPLLRASLAIGAAKALTAEGPRVAFDDFLTVWDLAPR